MKINFRHLELFNFKTKNVCFAHIVASSSSSFSFEIPFYLQSVLVHSANYVKDVYSGM
jgi:hypothetical protein